MVYTGTGTLYIIGSFKRMTTDPDFKVHLLSAFVAGLEVSRNLSRAVSRRGATRRSGAGQTGGRKGSETWPFPNDPNSKVAAIVRRPCNVWTAQKIYDVKARASRVARRVSSDYARVFRTGTPTLINRGFDDAEETRSLASADWRRACESAISERDPFLSADSCT